MRNPFNWRVTNSLLCCAILSVLSSITIPSGTIAEVNNALAETPTILSDPVKVNMDGIEGLGLCKVVVDSCNNTYVVWSEEGYFDGHPNMWAVKCTKYDYHGARLFSNLTVYKYTPYFCHFSVMIDGFNNVHFFELNDTHLLHQSLNSTMQVHDYSPILWRPLASGDHSINNLVIRIDDANDLHLMWICGPIYYLELGQNGGIIANNTIQVNQAVPPGILNDSKQWDRLDFIVTDNELLITTRYFYQTNKGFTQSIAFLNISKNCTISEETVLLSSREIIYPPSIANIDNKVFVAFYTYSRISNQCDHLYISIDLDSAQIQTAVSENISAPLAPDVGISKIKFGDRIFYSSLFREENASLYASVSEYNLDGLISTSNYSIPRYDSDFQSVSYWAVSIDSCGGVYVTWDGEYYNRTPFRIRDLYYSKSTTFNMNFGPLTIVPSGPSGDVCISGTIENSSGISGIEVLIIPISVPPIVQNISSDGNRSAVFNFRLFLDSPQRIVLVLDSINEFIELNRSDNKVTINFLGVPDLVLKTVTSPKKKIELESTHEFTCTIINNGSSNSSAFSVRLYDGKTLISTRSCEGLMIAEERILPFEWLPKTTGIHNLSFKIVGVSELNETNNSVNITATVEPHPEQLNNTFLASLAIVILVSIIAIFVIIKWKS